VQIEDRVVVVTGAASGIGRALAERFHAEGARGVVLTDLDPSVGAVADALGDRATAVVGDATAPSLIDTVCDTATRMFGPVDLFCANAGVAVDGSEQADDDAFELSLDVNLHAHVRAARRLVPEWLERGEGYFLSTASAAGLLTQVGSAPYTVSKHAAVGFAEWLAVTYGDQGIRVSCLCPMGVDTPLLQGGFDGPGSAAAATVKAAGDVLTAEAVADVVVEGIREERFLLLPHPEVQAFARRKIDDHDRWIAGMQRLQARVEG
jgi:NAD(P)-dependent dehydrogenase (short-subunit alcohol dehydrogenase family)